MDTTLNAQIERGAEGAELVRALIDSLQDMVFTTDAEGRFTGVFGRAFHEAGLREADFLGRTPMDVNGPESRSLHARAIETLRSGKPVRYEWPQGDVVYQTSATPQFDEAGGVVGIVAVRSDVTQLREQERELAYRHRALFEGSASVMLLIDAESGEIVDANPAALAYYGYRHDEITRLEITDINTLSADQVQREMRRARSQERRFFEFRHRRADGSVRDVHVYSGPVDLMGRKLLYSIVHDVNDQKRAEGELRLRSAALEAAANGVVITDAAGTVLFANEAVVQMTGFAREELIGANPRLLKSGEQPAEFYEEFWATIFAGRVWHGDIVNRRKDGSLYTEEMTVAPVVNASGAIANFVAIKQDVSSVRQVAADLERSEAWWRAVLENGMDLVAVDDPNGTFRYVSPSVKRILGYEPEELIGTTGFDLIHPEDAERIRRSFTEKTKHTNENELVTMRFRHKDGSWRVLEAVSKNAMDDPHVGGMIVNARDVTERVEAERQHRLLESAVVNTRDAVVIVGADLEPEGPTVLYANPAFYGLTGYSEDEVLGKNPSFLHGPKTDREELARIRRALSVAEPVRAEVVNYAKDGRAYLVELEIAPVRDENGKLTHFISVQRDITERREQERRLLRFQQFRRRIEKLTYEASSRSLSPGFFDKVLEYAIELVPGAEAGSLLVKRDDAQFQYMAVRGFDAGLLSCSLPAANAFPPGDEREPVIQRGYDPKSPTLSQATLDVLFGEGVQSGNIQESVHVPVWIDDELRAILNLDTFSTTTAFNDDDVEMTRQFGRHVGVILQRLDLEAIVVKQATIDPLTSLPNRLKGEEMLATTIAAAKRTGQTGGLCLLDVDNFKGINDAHGHAVGDAVMKEIGRRLHEAASSFGTAARWTGDEFMVICPHVASVEGMTRRANSILDQFVAPIRIGQASIRVGVRMGAVSIPAHAASVGEATHHAHIALHEAKRSGKRGFTVYAPGLSDAIARHTRIQSALHEAVANREIHLHYQPRVDLKHERVTSVEALARWTDAELGVVSPGEFITVAEESDLIFDLGRFVLDAACRQAKEWLVTGSPRIVAVNLSLKQLSMGDILADVRNTLERYELSPRWLELEITESAAMSDVDATLDILFALHELGVTLSIDDFGTAYSSLARLKMLPIDAIKIDSSFIKDLPDDVSAAPRDASIVQAIVALGRSMKLKIVAEGVETEAQKNFLRFLGCDEGQGYLWSKPVPADEFAARFRP